MSDNMLGCVVLIVAIVAAALVAIVWLVGQPNRPRRVSTLDKVLAPQPPMWTWRAAPARCDDEMPSILPGAPVLCEKPEGHANAHRSGETTWSLTARP